MASRTAGMIAAGVLAVHLAAGIGALWMLPHGFALDDLHLWSNTVIPAACCLGVVGALIAFAVRRWRAGVSSLAAAAAGGWASAIITGLVLFMLTFTSRSPDRTWTILSPGPHGSHRTLARYKKTPSGFRAAYVDDGESTLVAVEDGDRIAFEAVSRLGAPVYSHLNAFTTLYVPFDATLTFGPTGAARFPIEPADYPSGRPAQLAYLDAAGRFRVVRARDAEKGPFRELAEGPLDRGAPLILEIRPRDDRDLGCRLVFEDWTAQVSTEPSPTAGWGVPQGSIQFFSRDGVGLVVISLAETGPGRGFDSVGHAAGTYRNHLRVEPIH